MLSDSLAAKEAVLLNFIRQYKQPAVAFSGGVDSSVLLAACCRAGVVVKPFMVESCFIPQFEREDAAMVAVETKTSLTKISMNPLTNLAICRNDGQRCYHCKKLIMTAILEEMRHSDCEVLFDGANVDDASDYRPGMQATKELGVVSPFLAADLKKAEIRALAHEYGLSVAEKPAYACLASRIAYGEELTDLKLRRVEIAEAELRKLGLKNLRVRCHGNLARIEVAPEQIGLLVNLYQKKTVEIIKAAGFTFVTLDLQGYRTGSLNSSLKNNVT